MLPKEEGLKAPKTSLFLRSHTFFYYSTVKEMLQQNNSWIPQHKVQTPFPSSRHASHTIVDNEVEIPAALLYCFPRLLSVGHLRCKHSNSHRKQDTGRYNQPRRDKTIGGNKHFFPLLYS